MSNLRYRKPSGPDPDEGEDAEFEGGEPWWSRFAGPLSVFAISGFVALIGLVPLSMFNMMALSFIPGNPWLTVWLGLTLLLSLMWYMVWGISELLLP